MQHASDIDKGIEAGLADVIACTSSISLVDGASGRLLYRGYDIAELAEQSSFEEVAYLLWFGRLPGVVEFRAFLDGFSGSMKMPVETVMILRMFPHAATPMEVLRTAVSSLGHWDPDSGNTRLDACLRKAQRITERTQIIETGVEELVNARKVANKIENEHDKAIAYHDTVAPKMEEIRYQIDKLELTVADELWTLPKYRELLFIR